MRRGRAPAHEPGTRPNLQDDKRFHDPFLRVRLAADHSS
jgi:hypothetical protein